MEIRVATVRGYRFDIKCDDNLRKGTFIDTGRNYKEICTVDIPEDARKNPAIAQTYFYKIARIILENYARQYKEAIYSIEWTNTVILTPAEMKLGYGRPNFDAKATKGKLQHIVLRRN